jgi:predicted enzyme related to lactoylglutathione lyase
MSNTATSNTAPSNSVTSNPAETFRHAINWFEIPSTDLERAATFYEKLFDRKIRREHFGEPMAIFMSSKEGVGGTLVQRADQSPSDSGVLIYLNADGVLADAVARIPKIGGTVLVPVTEIPGGFGRYAVLRDTEGNRIALHEH